MPDLPWILFFLALLTVRPNWLGIVALILIELTYITRKIGKRPTRDLAAMQFYPSIRNTRTQHGRLVYPDLVQNCEFIPRVTRVESCVLQAENAPCVKAELGACSSIKAYKNSKYMAILSGVGCI